jgi:hypothetical protein
MFYRSIDNFLRAADMLISYREICKQPCCDGRRGAGPPQSTVQVHFFLNFPRSAIWSSAKAAKDNRYFFLNPSKLVSLKGSSKTISPIHDDDLSHTCSISACCEK